MNKLVLFFGVLICLVAVNARHFSDRNEDEASDDQDTLLKRREHSRHRRRRWQSNYGYDYAPPSYYPDRRAEDYDRNTQETIQQIYRLLEDISSYIRRPQPPPPPPQPIYIPYPVLYPAQVSCRTPQTNPNVTKRFPAMEDTNQNWGFVVPNEDFDDGNDGARPISFSPLPIIPNLMLPAPKVEHGSQQGAQSTVAPSFLVNDTPNSAPSLASSVPGMCNAAILSCCGFSGDKTQQKQCFSNVGCDMTYADGSVCSSDSIARALNSFRQAYSPK